MDDTKFDRLERLARLKADGSLNESEYLAEKAKLLAQEPSALSGTPAPTVEAEIDETTLSPIWRQRFQLIDEHGMPGDRLHTEAMRRFDTWERVRLSLSPLAFVLGPFYYLYLGLWRPALTLCGVLFVLAIIEDRLNAPEWVDRLWYFVPNGIYAFACIPLYYLRVRRGIHSWNPLIWWNH